MSERIPFTYQAFVRTFSVARHQRLRLKKKSRKKIEDLGHLGINLAVTCNRRYQCFTIDNINLNLLRFLDDTPDGVNESITCFQWREIGSALYIRDATKITKLSARTESTLISVFALLWLISGGFGSVCHDPQTRIENSDDTTFRRILTYVGEKLCTRWINNLGLYTFVFTWLYFSQFKVTHSVPRTNLRLQECYVY